MKNQFFSLRDLMVLYMFQDFVYEKCVDNLVSSCLEGFNATVFAYGQTVSMSSYYCICSITHCLIAMIIYES